MVEEVDDFFLGKRRRQRELNTVDDFWNLVAEGIIIQDVAIPRGSRIRGDWKKKNQKVFYKLFKNVRFSHTMLKEITFTRCLFVNCVFIGTSFESIRFDNCHFKLTNFLKCKIRETYVHPEAFDRCFDKSQHANIGVHLYQQLMRNFSDTDQPDLYKQAEYKFRQWSRYELEYKIAEDIERGLWPRVRCGLSKAYERVLGYGVRLRILLRTTVLMFLFFWVLNHFLWDELGLQLLCKCTQVSMDISFYYTAISLSNLGYGDIVPTLALGRWLASVQAIVGAIWFAIMASMIFKKISR